MKIRLLVTIFALALTFPLAHAAEPTVAETVAAQVKENPAKAAEIVAKAIADNPGQAAAIVKAVVAASPNLAREVTAAAIKAVGFSAATRPTLEAIVTAATEAAPNLQYAVKGALLDSSRAGVIPSQVAAALDQVVSNTRYVAPILQNETAGGTNQQENSQVVHNPIVIEAVSPSTTSPR